MQMDEWGGKRGGLRLGSKESERDSRFYFFLFFSLNYFTVARARVLFLLFFSNNGREEGGKRTKKRERKIREHMKNV